MRDEQLLDELLRITDTLAADMDRYLRGHGLTSTKAHLLWTLHGSGPARQRDLAAALGQSARHVTTLVDELITAGHVTRRAHPQDRRAVLIELTPEAASLLDQMAAGRVELGRQLFGHLDDQARDQLGARLHELGELLAGLAQHRQR